MKKCDNKIHKSSTLHIIYISSNNVVTVLLRPSLHWLIGYIAILFCLVTLLDTVGNYLHFLWKIVPRLSSDPPRHREYGGGIETTRKIGHIEFTEKGLLYWSRTTYCLPEHTLLTSYSLSWYFRSDPVDNAFAKNVSYSVGHLTSIL